MTLQSSKGIFQALETSAASLTSVSSATLLASTVLFSQKTSWSWLFDHPCHQNDQLKSLFVDWIFKNPIFHWCLVPCRRLLRPAFVIFLKIGWWNSNAQTSGTHWYLHYNLKVIFRWSPRPSKYIKTGQKTLYILEICVSHSSHIS